MPASHHQSPPSPPQSPNNTSQLTTTQARPTISLQKSPQSNGKSSSKSNKIIRRMMSVFRAFPIVTPACRIPMSSKLHDGHVHGGTRITGTLFGHRKARVNLAIQENSRCLPMLVLELAIPTGKLLQDMGLGLVRIALECEKQPNEKTRLIEEPVWTMYCNGKKTGYGIKREATDDDLYAMQMLHAVSMGAGVLPIGGGDGGETQEGELTYMRAFFERVVGSRDSETYYMMNPDGSAGPELSIFFVRV